MDAFISVGSQNERNEVHTVSDIRMGKRMKPNDDSYNEKDVIDNLGAKAYR
jgi:hypothetical protein